MDSTRNNTSVTMTDVALRAGVSQTTVSRVLSNHPRINEQTRKQVFSAIRELGYRHIGLSDALRQTERIVVGMFICPLPEQKNPLGLDFFSGIITGIQESAAENHIEVKLATLAAEAGNLETHGNFSGLILMGYPSQNLLDRLHRDRISYVVVSGDDNFNSSCNLVTVNNVEGGMIACRHLLERGSKRIGLIMTKHNMMRISGLRAEMLNHGLSIAPEDLHIVNSSDISSFVEIIHRWIAAGNLPDTLVISFYDAAVTVKTMLTLNGIRVPEDIYLFTFKHRIGDNIIPGLRQPPAEIMGRKAMARLQELLQNPNDTPHRVIMPMTIELD